MRAASAASCRTCSATRSTTARAGRSIVYVDSDADAVAIAVRDYGVGMTEAEAGRVFDRFWRADPSRQRTHRRHRTRPGDLARGRGRARRRLDVWSEPGQGSCFRLTLPRRVGELVMGSPLAAAARDGCRADSEVAA